MRVIKSEQDPIEIQITCENCKSVLGIVANDIKDCNAFGTWVDCPICKKAIPIKSVPYSWKKLINWDELGN